jgi:hypothetical protein
VISTVLVLSVLAALLLVSAFAALGPRAKERDAIGLQLTLEHAGGNEPLDIDPAVHRTAAIHRRGGR